MQVRTAVKNKRGYIFDKPSNMTSSLAVNPGGISWVGPWPEWLRKLPPPKRDFVSIAIGIKCRDGIVFAADSQTTRGSYRDCRTNKIVEVQFKNGAALVARAGGFEYGEAFMVQLQKITRDSEMIDEEGLSEVLLRASREFTKSTGDNLGYPTHDEKVKHMLESQTKVLLGCMIGEKPVVLSIWIGQGNVVIEKHVASAIGCGSELALYLLNDIIGSEPISSDFALIIAGYVIESVKKNDAYCGGATTMGVAFNRLTDLIPENAKPVSSTEMLSSKDVNDFIEIAFGAESETKEIRWAEWLRLSKEKSDKVRVELWEKWRESH